MFDCIWLSVPVQLIAWKDSSPNDLLCVEWDVKPYILTLSVAAQTTGENDAKRASQTKLLLFMIKIKLLIN